MINIFDDIVDLYDSARPGYPQKLFEDIIAYSKIDLSAKILEIGAGTGQATSFFANHGYRINALEIGKKQVAFLTEKYKTYSNVCINRKKFETVSSDLKFDLLVAASSFHWIDKNIRYKKAYSIMKSGGTLAQFWHMHPVQKFSGGVFDEINEVYQMYFRNKEFYGDAELKKLIKKRIYQLATNSFEDISFYEYKYERRYSSSEYMALLSTYSYVQSLKEQKNEFLLQIYNCLEKHGGSIQVPDIVHLYLAKK